MSDDWIVGLRGGIAPKKWVALKKIGDQKGDFEPARDADRNVLYFNSPSEAVGAMIDGEIKPEEWKETIVAGSVGICKRCGKPLFLSFNKVYSYQCFECEEDFYAFEQEGN